MAVISQTSILEYCVRAPRMQASARPPHTRLPRAVSFRPEEEILRKYKEEYVDKGRDFYAQKYRRQQVRMLQRKAAELGL
jgi:hypothetical protein